MLQIKNSVWLKSSWSAVLLALLTMLLLTACAELDSHSQISRFQKSEDVYRASMRWGEWTNMFQLMRDKPGSDINSTKLKPLSDEHLTHLETIKVKHIEVLSSGMNEEEGTGESRLKIEYRFDHSAKIQSFKHTVSWWYDKESNNWFTSTPLPEEFDLPKSRTIKLSPRR